jgi:hypothetical protein
LQALPYLKNLTSLMNYPLGKVVLEALAAGIFWLGHILTTGRGRAEVDWWLYASTSFRLHECRASIICKVDAFSL